MALFFIHSIIMLAIRFQRVGRRNDPAFRIVVTERRSKPKGSGIEILGSYHPKTKQTALKNGRILYWISKGAKASDTVRNLLISKGVIQGKKIAVVKAAPTASAPAEAPAADAVSVVTPTAEKEASAEAA
jgi:small subunit ribosomal protein S16